MLPFTTEQFFEVFASYNKAVWPWHLAAYALALAALAAILTRRAWAGRFALAALGGLWLVNGVGYHLMFFSAINGAAYGFAALFVVQGLLFLAYAFLGGQLFLAFKPDWRSLAALVLIVYAMLVYNLLGALSGHAWPHMPAFGVAPCPTTIFTFGVLMLSQRRIPFWLLAIPLLWAAIGSTAAILLSVPEDFGLLIAGVLGAYFLALQSRAPSGKH